MMHIRRKVHEFVLEKFFLVNEKVDTCNRILKYILHEMVSHNYRDPPWITHAVEKLIQNKMDIYNLIYKIK